jgi:HK97 gp10 family phage protein
MAVFFWTNKQGVTDSVHAIVERIALEVTRDAKRFAPVDTGTLQGSITPVLQQADSNAVIYLVGTNIFYGPFQEFGTSRIPPHPYLGKALEIARGKYA